METGVVGVLSHRGLRVEVDNRLDENLCAIIPRHPESERGLVAASDKGVYARVSENA